MQESLGRITDMQIVALEVCFEEHNRFVDHGSVGKIIDQQIQAHAWANPEYRSKAEGNAISPFQQVAIQLDLELAIKRNGAHQRSLIAIDALLSDSIARIGARKIKRWSLDFCSARKRTASWLICCAPNGSRSQRGAPVRQASARSHPQYAVAPGATLRCEHPPG